MTRALCHVVQLYHALMLFHPLKQNGPRNKKIKSSHKRKDPDLQACLYQNKTAKINCCCISNFQSIVLFLLCKYQNVLFCEKKKTGHIFDSVVITNSFFKCLTLSEAMKPFTKHFSLIFKFPLRFKRNLIHMFLIHLHSAHKNCSSI